MRNCLEHEQRTADGGNAVMGKIVNGLVRMQLGGAAEVKTPVL